MSTRTSLINEIENAVTERSLLKHPFYQAWSAGTLTKQQLAGYAKEYYWAARNVPHVMDAIKKNAPENLSKRMRSIFTEQAKEEKTGAHERRSEGRMKNGSLNNGASSLGFQAILTRGRMKALAERFTTEHTEFAEVERASPAWSSQTCFPTRR